MDLQTLDPCFDSLSLQKLTLLSACGCRAAGLELSLDDFQAVSDRVPFIADLKPSGKYVMEDVHRVRDLSLPFPSHVVKIIPIFSLLGCVCAGGWHASCPQVPAEERPH